MRIAKTSLCLVVSLSIAWFLGTALTVLIVDVSKIEDNHPHNHHGPFPADKFEHLMWFMQISDIHLSRFRDAGRAKDLLYFCQEVVGAIKPSIVLATGDLTDAKTSDQQGSRQYLDEWQTYDNILKVSGVLNRTVWLDVRGNHDAFDIPDWNSDRNYYREYSIQGHKDVLSYRYELQSGWDKYSFIAVDACPNPGPRRPFNFFGVLNKHSVSQLEDFSAASASSNLTVWFGHYPTSTIMSSKPGIREIMRNGAVYLCGHFHTLGGLIHQMYTRHHNGNLELELADWKDNRMFRVGVVDHELFSFIDVPLRQWPVILITNPKNALYVIPNHEPISRIKNSTHIRVLVFSTAAIKSVKIQIDLLPWQQAIPVKGPLYVLSWDPKQFSIGIHTITVKAEDLANHVQSESQSFSLDGTWLDFRIIPKLLLMTDLVWPMQLSFGFLLILTVVPLCIFRFAPLMIPEPMGRTFAMRCILVWLKRLQMLSSLNQLFYPIILSALYVAIGPWFIGEIIEGYYGVCFVYGLYINKKFLPGELTYGYGCLDFLLFHIPLIFCLARCSHFRYKHLHQSAKCSFLRYLLRHCVLFFIILYQAWCAHTFYLNYGSMAFFLGPVKSWSTLMAVVLWRIASTLPENSFALYETRLRIKKIEENVIMNVEETQF